MIRTILTMTLTMIVMAVSAQKSSDVQYIEKQGNGGTRVFAVSGVWSKKADEANSLAKLKVIEALLLKGVEIYNGGRPLCNPDNPEAKSIVDPKKNGYSVYCKEVYREGETTDNNFIVVVNHFNLHRVLKMKGALAAPFEDD